MMLEFLLYTTALAALPGGEEVGIGAALPTSIGSVVSAAMRPIGRGLAEGAIEHVKDALLEALAETPPPNGE